VFAGQPSRQAGTRVFVLRIQGTRRRTGASTLPDWLVTGNEPVPLTQSFRTQAMTTQIYAFIMSLIDGKRSIEDMAKILEQQKLMTRKEAVPAIRSFLTRMYDDSQRQQGY
jgi:hypothetical protein